MLSVFSRFARYAVTGNEQQDGKGSKRFHTDSNPVGDAVDILFPAKQGSSPAEAGRCSIYKVVY